MCASSKTQDCALVQMGSKRAHRESKWLKTGPKWPKVGSKWVKIGQHLLKMAQNRLKMAQWALQNGNCDQIPRRGAANYIDLRPLGRQGPNLGHKGAQRPHLLPNLECIWEY